MGFHPTDPAGAVGWDPSLRSLRRGEGEQQGHGVIDAGVAVDDEAVGHKRR